MSFNHELTFASRKRKRGRWLFAALVILVAAGGLAYVLRDKIRPSVAEMESTLPVAETTPEAQSPAAATEPEPPPVVKVQIEYVVQPKDSLGEIFTRLKLDVNDIPEILNLPLVRDRFKPLQPGDELMFALEDGALHGLNRRIDATEVLSITRGDSGFTAEVVETPIEVKTAQVRGTINATLFTAGHAVGLSPEMIQQLADDIFAWDVDLALDVRPGDRFKVVYEQKFRGDEYLGVGPIVAAELVINDGEVHRAVRYVSSDGKINGYFTPDGHNVRRPFLCAPIDVMHVSANANRPGSLPLLSTLSDHQGIDYPAPVGTVVKAAGDGRIKFVGVDGDYGNTVVIAHGGTISTLYAHLSKFASALQPGKRVKQGETIGYVGSSGAATAPHLHYEYRVNGTYADPHTVEQPAGEPIPSKYLADFQSKAAALLADLDQSGDAVVTAALAE